MRASQSPYRLDVGEKGCNNQQSSACVVSLPPIVCWTADDGVHFREAVPFPFAIHRLEHVLPSEAAISSLNLKSSFMKDMHRPNLLVMSVRVKATISRPPHAHARHGRLWDTLLFWPLFMLC